MLDLRNTIASSTRSQIEFLLIDIDLAFTFLNIASTTENPETRERNRRNARIAYDSVARLASRPILSGRNLDLVWERMAHLKRALELFEEKLKMTEHTLRCLDLKPTARHDFTGWSWIVDGPESRNAAIARDEDSAKNACLYQCGEDKI
jgi:hypothetical protein